jgi:hypothetical protein
MIKPTEEVKVYFISIRAGRIAYFYFVPESFIKRVLPMVKK